MKNEIQKCKDCKYAKNADPWNIRCTKFDHTNGKNRHGCKYWQGKPFKYSKGYAKWVKEKVVRDNDA